MRPIGLNLGQWAVLREAARSPGASAAAVIADFDAEDRAAFTRLATRFAASHARSASLAKPAGGRPEFLGQDLGRCSQP